MAILIDKSTRLGLGLNTLTRNIVYVALALRGLTRTIPAYKDSVSIAISQRADADSVDGTFNAKIVLLVLPEGIGKNSLNRLGYIQPFSDLTPDNPPAIAAVSGLLESLPTEPENLSLEQYLYWCGIVLGCSTYPSLDYFKETLNDKPSSGNPTLTIEFSLPLDYRKYLLNQDAIASVSKIFDYHITDPSVLPETTFTTPPNPQYWGNPLADIEALKALSGQTLNSTRWVASKQALYTLTASGEPDDSDLWIAPTTQVNTEIWKKASSGNPGTPGADGEDGLSAYQIWLNLGNTGTEQDFIDSLQGEPGATGATGAQGPQGETGATGPQGEPGATGATGAQGPQGEPGADGEDGLSAYQIWLNLGNTGTEQDFIESLRPYSLIEGAPNGVPITMPTTEVGFNYFWAWLSDWSWLAIGQPVFISDGSNYGVFTVAEFSGGGNNPTKFVNTWGLTTGTAIAAGAKVTPCGLPGPQGETGATGATGSQGPAGNPGTDGADGEDGLSAYQIWLNLGNTGTEQDFIDSLQGPQGATGTTGPQGPQGATGTTGPQGPQGATGPQGPQGATGPQGPAGTVDPSLTENAQTGTSYTLVLSDAGKLVTMNNASANTVTIPTNASVAFPTGTQILLGQKGAGTTTYTPASGVNLNGANTSKTSAGQWKMVTLIKVSTNDWWISGGIN